MDVISPGLRAERPATGEVLGRPGGRGEPIFGAHAVLSAPKLSFSLKTSSIVPFFIRV
jgi:hypothetical protein